jgi:hypothetical protein
MKNYFCVVQDLKEEKIALNYFKGLCYKHGLPKYWVEQKILDNTFPKTFLLDAYEFNIYPRNVYFSESFSWINITNSLVKFENYSLKYLL